MYKKYKSYYTLHKKNILLLHKEILYVLDNKSNNERSESYSITSKLKKPTQQTKVHISKIKNKEEDK